MSKIQLNENEWNKLDLFLRRFEQLERTRFYSNPKLKNIQYKIKGEKVDKGFQTRFEIKVPDEETIKSFLLSFRVFYMEGEHTNFYSICNLLYKKILDKKVRNDMVTIRSNYSKALNTSFIGINFLGKSYSPKDIVDLWFNAEYFHTDIEKVKELDKIVISPGKSLFFYLLIDAVITLTNQISMLKEIIVWVTSDSTI
ncbi:MAG: hypothetical protein WBF68_01895 [Atribacterota bacterium]